MENDEVNEVHEIQSIDAERGEKRIIWNIARVNRENWEEERQNLGSEAEWKKFVEILDIEVLECVPLKTRDEQDI